MIFQCGLEPVLIHRILIGFEAIRENISNNFSMVGNEKVLLSYAWNSWIKLGHADKVNHPILLYKLLRVFV